MAPSGALVLRSHLRRQEHYVPPSRTSNVCCETAPACKDLEEIS